jgi:hypothetical protein
MHICVSGGVRLNPFADNWLEVGLFRTLEHFWHWQSSIEFVGFPIFPFFLCKVEVVIVFQGQFYLGNGLLLSYFVLLCSSAMVQL